MKFRICYFYERNGKTFVNIERNHKHYDRPCKILGDDRPVFQFLGRTWYHDRPLRRIYD